MFVHVDTPTLPELKVTTLASGKRTYVTPEGNKYPSITTLLGFKEKPWLEDWRNSLGHTKADKENKRARDRGDAIHAMNEKYLNNDPSPTTGYAPDAIRGFNQVKFRLNKINNIRCQESALYSDTLGLAGRVDCIGEYDGVLSIIDFKTSTNNKNDEMVEDYRLQCTAYAIMWHEMTGEPISNYAIIMSVEKGMVPLVFRGEIDKYVAPLLHRIDKYRKGDKS